MNILNGIGTDPARSAPGSGLTRRRLLRWSAVVGAGAAVPGLLTACGGSGGAASSDPDAPLKVGLDTDATALSAFRQQGSSQMLVCGALHRGLLCYESDRIAPAIAEKFEHKDHRVYTFTLRSGVKFHDGKPVTAQVVKANLEFLADPKSAAKLTSMLGGISQVETSGDGTVVVTLDRPDASFPSYLADVNAAILPEAALGSTDPTWVGAGPFAYTSSQKGSKITLKRFDDYYDGKAKLPGIEFHVYLDEAARDNALLSGELDMVSTVGWVDYDRVDNAEGLTLDITHDGPFLFLTFNTTKGPFADARVRQAVAYAVNRENVVATALEGRGTPMFGLPVPKSSEVYNEQHASHWKKDVEKAKSLLAEAGYEDGFKARLLTTSAPKFHQDTALSVQADLKKVGIEVTLESPDFASRVERGIKGDYDIAVYGSVGMVNDPSSLDQFLVGTPNQNRSFGFTDKDISDLIAQGRSATTPDERKKVYDRLQAAVLEKAPIVGLAWRDQGYGYVDTLKGFDNLPGFLTYESGYSFVDISRG